MSVEVDCLFKHETDSAILIVVEATGEQVWLPLSQVDEIHRNAESKGSVVISDWLADKKGLR